MPIPAAIAGSGLASWMYSIAQGLLAYKVFTIVARFAVFIAICSAVIGAIVFLKGEFQAITQGLLPGVIPAPIAAGIAMLPSNTDECMSAIIAAHGLAWTFQMNAVVLRIKMGGIA